MQPAGGRSEHHHGVADAPPFRMEDLPADGTKITRAKFIEIVNGVICRHSGIGINKFSIKCGLLIEYSDHLDRWIGFAASSKAKIINIDLTYKDYIFQQVHQFPLEALDAQGSSLGEPKAFPCVLQP
ncbi:hypothetical protein TRIUR3_01646 [Triticum urartu]|uniref:Uncharacterized protein n=1 Tax=Triticum urartu TaxID=4572 RepID=M7YXJ3_TRIUA|nr:hypothetical protein TRIUR3_01646 [Triticum urartu]